MPKYQSFERQAKPIRRKDPHPIWRGIGCLIMLLVPAISLGASTILVGMAPDLGLAFPPGLMGRPVMPKYLFYVPGLVGILDWIQSLDNLYAVLLVTFIVTVLLMGITALGYAFIYRIAGPGRYTRFDAPPPNIKTKKYKR